MSKTEPHVVDAYELDEAPDATYEISRVFGDSGAIWLVHARYAAPSAIPSVVHTVHHQPLQLISDSRYVGPVGHADLIRSMLLDGYSYARISAAWVPKDWSTFISDVVEGERYRDWPEHALLVDGVTTDFKSIDIEGCYFLAAQFGDLSIGLSCETAVGSAVRLVHKLVSAES